MIRLILIAIAAIALAGCSSFGTTPEPTPAVVMTTAPTPTPVAIIVEPTTVETTGGVIAIGTLLDKLNESGCTIDKIIYREVKRGGHVEVICKHTNDLALDTAL
jgi:PBP1b-binding outer membrane lipoprotein LpoB